MKGLVFSLLLVAHLAAHTEEQNKMLQETLIQIKEDSPVVARMLRGIRNLVLKADSLPGSELATTELDGGAITIRVDVEKVLRNHHSLVNTVIHEVTHADDIANWPITFAKIELEDRALPWGSRRLELRAVQRTGIITTYLTLQFPGKYTSSITIILQ